MSWYRCRPVVPKVLWDKDPLHIPIEKGEGFARVLSVAGLGYQWGKNTNAGEKRDQDWGQWWELVAETAHESGEVAEIEMLAE